MILVLAGGTARGHPLIVRFSCVYSTQLAQHVVGNPFLVTRVCKSVQNLRYCVAGHALSFR